MKRNTLIGPDGKARLPRDDRGGGMRRPAGAGRSARGAAKSGRPTRRGADGAGGDRGDAGGRRLVAIPMTELLARLRRAYPGATCALTHHDPLQLLVATILSAQCTDERVNQVTPGLFAKYRSAADFAAADLTTLEGEIRPTGFFRHKARAIIGMAQGLVTGHGGQVPRDLEALVALPGVGRKTANVVLGTAFGIAAGVVVDTHVRRLSYRLGLTDHTDPDKIEIDLMAVVPRSDWVDFSHLMIHHGRQRCSARKPDCAGCELADLCPKRLS